MAVGLEDIARAIGELTARVEMVDENQKRAAEEARESRHRVANAAQVTALQLQALEHRLGTVEQSVRKIEPFAEEMKAWKQRGIGALAFAGLIGSGVTWLIPRIVAAVWPG